MESNEIDQLLISASETLANILKQIHFEAIAYNGNLEFILKGLFATALKTNDQNGNISWIAMDKNFSKIQEDMKIYLQDDPRTQISIEFKSTLSVDKSSCIKSAASAIRQIKKYENKSHRYIIHFLSNYINRSEVFSAAPIEIKNKYPNANYANDPISPTDKLISYYTDSDEFISQSKPILNTSDLILTINSRNILDISSVSKPVSIFIKEEIFKIDCCIFKVEYQKSE